MANEERKIQYGIKGKLISAIAMLLVAVIMTVSSTYAWFTLSTAPEVTGISTAVGANGALEMFLLTGSTANGTEDVFGDKNTLWGNLVNLSAHTTYGTDRIILYPSKLNTSLSNQISMNSPLQFPKYGADGRINGEFGSTMLSGGNRENGRLQNFVENDLWGFRAVGSTSGLSDREIALRSATANVNIYATQAKGKAELSLTEHGAVLADMAIQKVLRDDPTFGDDEYNAVAGMIARLEEALAILDEAYQQAVLAWAASNLTSADDTVYNAVKAIVENDAQYANIEKVIEAINGQIQSWKDTLTGLGVNLPENVTLGLPTWIVGDGLTQFNQMKADVNTAKNSLTALLNDTNSTTGADNVKTPKEDAEFSYAELSGALRPLVNMDKLKINGIALDSEGSKDAIMQSAVNTRAVTVSMVTGTGVYADMADQAGNYQASIKVDVGALIGGSGMLFDAVMKAETTLSNPYLQIAISEAKTAKAPSANAEASPFSEYYGYIVDLGFRTNAAMSNLLLQQEGVDRIYADNNNEATMGGGSSMTFTSTDLTGFSTDKVKALMSHIRIVFFNPDVKDGGCDIYAYAKLDMSKAEVSNGQVTAPMYLYETVTAYTLDGATVFRSEAVVTTTGEGETAVTTTTYKYYSDYTMETLVKEVSNDAENATIADTEKTVEVEKEDGIITALTQNALQKVSALVYLDGETITNADVAAEAAASMTGTANFQFASDAKLQPMEYGDLHTPNAPETNS